MKRPPYEGKLKEFNDAVLMFSTIHFGFTDALSKVRGVEKAFFGKEVSDDVTDLLDTVEFNTIVKNSLREDLKPVWDWFIGNVPKEQKPQLLLDAEEQERAWHRENG